VVKTKTKVEKVTKTKTAVVTQTAVVTETDLKTLVVTQTFDQPTTVVVIVCTVSPASRPCKMARA
jgi:hypothetical protein